MRQYIYTKVIGKGWVPILLDLNIHHFKFFVRCTLDQVCDNGDICNSIFFPATIIIYPSTDCIFQVTVTTQPFKSFCIVDSIDDATLLITDNWNVSTMFNELFNNSKEPFMVGLKFSLVNQYSSHYHWVIYKTNITE